MRGDTFWGEFGCEIDWSAIEDVTSDDGHGSEDATKVVGDDGTKESMMTVSTALRQMWHPTSLSLIGRNSTPRKPSDTARPQEKK